MEHHLLADSEFHYPQLHIDNEELKARVEAELQGFMINQDKLEWLERIFDRECDLGLLNKAKDNINDKEASGTTTIIDITTPPSPSPPPSIITATTTSQSSTQVTQTNSDEPILPSSEKSTFLMANTHIPGHYPNGHEVGDYLSLDLGSTNFRVLWSTFTGDPTNCETHVRFYDVPQKLRRGDCKKLFDFLASCISDFVKSFDKLITYHSAVIGSNSGPLKLGFTFSFPTHQTAIDKAILLTWTKSFDCPDAIGKDVVQLLQDAIDRLQHLRIKVIAILNDTTGTLLQGRFVDRDCAIGMIVGSGGNICYLEKVSTMARLANQTTLGPFTSSNHRIVDKITEPNCNGDSINSGGIQTLEPEMAIDIECGAFGDDGKINFIHTKYDETVDKNSLFTSSFTFEKLYGGNFLGEICRYVILDFAQQSILFNGKVTPKMSIEHSLQSPVTSAIESPSCSQFQVSQILRTAFDLDDSDVSNQDVKIVQFIVARLFVRNALILAACLSALLKRMNRSNTVIAVDGSVYKKHPKFHKLLTDFTKQLAPNHIFKIIGVDDGSGRGGALAAAIADEIATCSGRKFSPL